MKQDEIDEISDAFSEAWNEFFGQEMYYVPFDRENSPVHDLYNESSHKVYKWEDKVKFNGTFREEKYEEREEISGRDNFEKAEITFVTKELYDAGVIQLEQSSIIEIFHRNGVRKLYNIISNYGKVQLGNNKVFTKLDVVEITNFKD